MFILTILLEGTACATQCYVWICDLRDQIAIYICTSDELDQRLTFCPSVLDDATNRVPEL
jgi:hypothetical protein